MLGLYVHYVFLLDIFSPRKATFITAKNYFNKNFLSMY